MKSIIFYTSILIVFFSLIYFSPYFIILAAISFIAYLIFNFVPEKNEKSIGIKLLSMKKIHTDYGKFFIHLEYGEPGYTNNVYLFKSKLFCCEPIDTISFYKTVDISYIKSEINKILDRKYGRIKAHKETKDSLWKMIMKDWNGTTTEVLNRDKKIDEIL